MHAGAVGSPHHLARRTRRESRGDDVGELHLEEVAQRVDEAVVVAIEGRVHDVAVTTDPLEHQPEAELARREQSARFREDDVLHLRQELVVLAQECDIVQVGEAEHADVEVVAAGRPEHLDGPEIRDPRDRLQSGLDPVAIVGRGRLASGHDENLPLLQQPVVGGERQVRGQVAVERVRDDDALTPQQSHGGVEQVDVEVVALLLEAAEVRARERLHVTGRLVDEPVDPRP